MLRLILWSMQNKWVYDGFSFIRKLLLLTLAISGFDLLEPLHAQQIEGSQFDQTNHAFAHTVALYDRQLNRNTMVFTGVGYYDPHGNVKGHQFFGEDYWELGSVNYDGDRYDSIFLKYDIYKDQLLIENFNSDGFLSPIILFSKKVSSFDLMNHHFIRIESDSTSNLRAGYYNQMYKGDNVQVLVKRRKEIVDSNEINSLSESFSQKDRYYLQKGDFFYQVRNKKSIIKVLEDHKKEVKAFIKKNVIQFRVQPDIQFVKVAKYYDSLP